MIAQIPCDMFKCALQLACMRSNRKHWRRLWLPLYGSCMISKYGRGRITAPGRFPYSFREACEFFKVPRIGLVKVERLSQRLNVPTQGRREAETGTKPFSLTALGSDPLPGIEHGPHWWEADVLTIRPPKYRINDVTLWRISTDLRDRTSSRRPDILQFQVAFASK